MESNSKVRAEMEYMGGEVYKRYRIFGKTISKISKEEDAEARMQQAKMEAMLVSPCG